MARWLTNRATANSSTAPADGRIGIAATAAAGPHMREVGHDEAFIRRRLGGLPVDAARLVPEHSAEKRLAGTEKTGDVYAASWTDRAVASPQHEVQAAEGRPSART